MIMVPILPGNQNSNKPLGTRILHLEGGGSTGVRVLGILSESQRAQYPLKEYTLNHNIKAPML